MPTRSGRAFLPNPDARQVAQSKQSNSRVTSRHDRVTRTSNKRKRADSNASLIELESKPSLLKARPSKRPKKCAKKSKVTQVEPLNTIDLTRDEDDTDQQTSRHRRAEDVQDQHDAEFGATSSQRTQHGPPKQQAQGVPAAMPDDTEIQSLWQVDLVGQRPPPSALIPFIDDQDMHDARPAYIAQAGRLGIQRQKTAPPPPARVMFTFLEAKHLVYGAGRNRATQAVPRYSLATGEYVPYPVTKSYHLGAMGRYTQTRAHSAQFTYVPSVPAPSTPVPSTSAPSTPAQSTGVDPVEYVFDWGAHYGSRIQDVPRAYIASLLGSPNLNQILNRRRGLLEALKSRVPNDPRLASPRPFGQPRTPPHRLSVRPFAQAQR